MKNIIKNILLGIIFTALVLSLSNCSEKDANAESEKAVENKHIVSIEVRKLTGNDFTDYIKVIGNLQPFQKANLGYLTGGKIERFVKGKGDFVNAGDTLVIIDNDILKANLSAAKAKYDLAVITYQKQNRIFKENVNSEYQLLQAKSLRDQAKANYYLMKARLNDTYITAPFNGIIDAKFYEDGEMAMPGSPIITLINASKMKAVAGVPERYAGKVKVGQNVLISVNEVALKNLSAKISYVGASVNINNRTFPIEIIFNRTKKSLKPEMIAELDIDNGQYKNLITIPADVVSRTDLGYSVYVAENGVARTKQIEILSRFGSKVAVKSGLNPGDELITVGYQNLLEGQTINVVK